MDGWMEGGIDRYMSFLDNALMSDSFLICSVLQERSSGVSLSFPVTLETRWIWDVSTSGQEK